MEQVALVLVIIKLFEMSGIYLGYEWIPVIRVLLFLSVLRLIYLMLRR